MNQDDEILKSQHLVPKAEAECQDLPCLWLRGIFPMGLTELKPEHQPLEQTYYVLRGPRKPEGEGSWPSATYFGDASGGFYTSYRTLRRVGMGIAAYTQEQGAPLFQCQLPLTGKVQTVPRGETQIFHVLILMLSNDSQIMFYTDNFGVWQN